MKKTPYEQLQLLGLAYRHRERATDVDDTRINRVREIPKGHSAIRDAIIVLLTEESKPGNSAHGLARNRDTIRARISRGLVGLRENLKVRSRIP